MCDYSDAYIVLKGIITVEGSAYSNARNIKLTFKNNASFRSDITKINSTFIDYPKDLNTVVSMYNLLEYSGNCSMASGS